MEWETTRERLTFAFKVTTRRVDVNLPAGCCNRALVRPGGLARFLGLGGFGCFSLEMCDNTEEAGLRPGCVHRPQREENNPTTRAEPPMSRAICFLSLALVLSGLLVLPAFAEPATDAEDKPAATAEKPAEEPTEEEPADEKASSPKSSPTKAKTHTVASESLVVKLSLDGVFEAKRMHELVLRPETWSSFKVAKAAEHGDRVEKGQVVVRFETEDIDRAIADLKRDLKLGDLAFRTAELEIETLERLMPMNLAAVERQQDRTEEDREYYLETEAPLARRTAEVVLEQTRQMVEYQREEVEQLERMYEADELTEETEEIVLRRARNALERAEFMLERAELSHERAVEVELPRQDVSVEESAKRAVLETELLQATLPLRLEQARVEFEKAKVARERSEERLAKLEADRKMMTLEAPAEGVVYFGRCVDGSWRRGSSAEALRPGGTLSANDVFMTIVEPRPLAVRASVAEKHLADLRQGLQGTATPAGFPKMELPVRLTRIAAVPDAGTKFDAVFGVSLDLEADLIMPGMTCSMEFLPYRQRGALVVPSKAVFTDDWNPQERYVWLYREGAKPERRTVVLGREVDEKTEVLEGLEAGDEILTTAPENGAKE